jgi:hypothetical protein
MQPLYTTDPLPLRNFLRFMVWVCLILGPVSCYWRFHHAHQALAQDAVANANLAAVEKLGWPIVAALDRYHADNGHYPPALDDLLLSPSITRGFHYFSRWLPSDVLASDDCAERAKHVQGWSLIQPESEQRNVERFVRECVSEVQSYALQSADFPPSADTTLERYGYYDPGAARWFIGWCQVSTGRGRSTVGNLGFCDHHHHPAIDYTARLAASRPD